MQEAAEAAIAISTLNSFCEEQLQQADELGVEDPEFRDGILATLTAINGYLREYVGALLTEALLPAHPELV